MFEKASQSWRREVEEGPLPVIAEGVNVPIPSAGLLVGAYADWSLAGATAIFLATLSLVMIASPLLLGSPVGAAITLLVWGGLGYAAVPVAGGLTAAVGLALVWLGRQRTASQMVARQS
ncbi:MAG TPA: hypothetical protein VNQ78_10165 [Paracoccus sp. (in: a-proteobacteria)]|uniref:hypothetical protein n=1 Tax=Paracoccus sp. TaxID=267 RepID=UPI002C9D6C50|nr:hypothetical protein [Paracoccus sp. (in: a-proteobacteria)]HWL57019.1 hypothetical protein [Paracoccus sp. (in: a-proteobacteria)]